ncbi:DUF642 domain-containing protein [Pseudoduganella sp. OTU4001]|uniref:DUF642 domain-containing protein n=1 Tax=Pseudoduganella sp. OTU4001 TaxID=3043854 RepID=UPI00313B20F0
MKRILSAVLLFAASAANAGTIELVKNGSFEKDVIAANSWKVQSTLDGWAVGTNQVEIRNNVVGAAQNGSQYLELDVYNNSSISQTFDTVNGGEYKLSFYYAARENTLATTNGIDVFWNGLLVKHLEQDNRSSVTNWIKYDLSLFAAGSQSKLEFVAAGNSDSYGGSLDNVSLTTNVPEPGTLMSVALGLGMLGFTLRRRQK